MISLRLQGLLASLRVRNALIARRAARSTRGPLTSADPDERFARAVHGARRTYDAMFGRLARPVSGVAMSSDDSAPVQVMWATPDEGSGATVLYLHGGGYAVGHPRHYVHVTSHLARTARARVAAPDYRLAPEHQYPSALDDAVATYEWLLTSGAAADRTVLCGDSAGGGLALAAALAIRDRGLPGPAGVAVMSPWLDLTASGATFVSNEDSDLLLVGAQLAGWGRLYAGDDVSEPYASPLMADLRGLPPLHLQVGTDEVLLGDVRDLAASASAVDVEVELFVDQGLPHVVALWLRVVPEARKVLGRLADFVERRTAKERP